MVHGFSGSRLRRIAVDRGERVANTLGLRYVFGFSTRQIRLEKISDGRGRWYGKYFFFSSAPTAVPYSRLYTLGCPGTAVPLTNCVNLTKEKKIYVSVAVVFADNHGGDETKKEQQKNERTKLNAPSPFKYCLE